ncbi:MAG: DUF4013 domain-containing protein [Thermoproteota archaeon]
MEIFESFSKSVDYVSKLLSRGAELIVMIIVNIIPIVNFIFLGYCAKIFKEGPAKDEPPKFENFGELFWGGLKIFVVGLLWALLPILILVLAFVLAAPWYWIGGGRGFARLGVTLIIAIFIALLAGIAVGIFGVIGLLLTAKTGEIAKGFSFQQIMAVINSVGFANHVIWVIVAAIITFIVGMLGTVLLIGWLIALVVSPPACNLPSQSSNTLLLGRC